jgi:hypothetical protein
VSLNRFPLVRNETQREGPADGIDHGLVRMEADLAIKT